ncbi:hypothetical protein HF086_016672 [Spodoptera exigua]|uniref:Uncharacterized protein n=1 Tax=Spodoptera exigua TaxID=7107 RepID=A0A922M4B4_SPOEX|nr:hypothetical protein HF086_016672 [Spodoptera exigua]
MTSALDETRFKIQNEIKATETKKSDKKNTTVVKIHEILKLDEMDEEIRKKDLEKDSDILDIMDLSELNYSNLPNDKDVTQSEGKQINRIREYWVQFNMRGGQELPPGATPLSYSPDRNSFVQLVFFLVLIMLIVTTGFVYFVYNTELRQTFLEAGFIFGLTGMIGIMLLSYAMVCSPCTRIPPCNFICLVFAVIFMSLIVAWITARYKTPLIFVALLSTTVTVLICLALACSSVSIMTKLFLPTSH